MGYYRQLLAYHFSPSLWMAACQKSRRFYLTMPSGRRILDSPASSIYSNPNKDLHLWDVYGVRKLASALLEQAPALQRPPLPQPMAIQK